MSRYAGKRVEFGIGTNNPEAMISINKDLRSLSFRTPEPEGSQIKREVKMLKEGISMLSEEIKEFQLTQVDDLQSLKASMKEMKSILTSIHKSN